MPNNPQWYTEGEELEKLKQKYFTDEEFCAAVLEKYGYRRRKAYYLMELHHLFANILRIQPPADIDWRKLVEIKEVLTVHNKERLFEFCRQHPREFIVKYLKEGGIV